MNEQLFAVMDRWEALVKSMDVPTSLQFFASEPGRAYQAAERAACGETDPARMAAYVAKMHAALDRVELERTVG